jgi:CheY-like chemotaxis protein
MKTGSTILVVDDNADFRELLKDMLVSRGFNIKQAADGEEALELLEKESADMSIVDLDMPRMNGLEFSQKVKEKMPTFPIVMVTAYASFYSPAEILASGVDAFLQKPINIDKLIKVIEQL